MGKESKQDCLTKERFWRSRGLSLLQGEARKHKLSKELDDAQTKGGTVRHMHAKTTVSDWH